ncbi:unnamed protein product [Camellia sinensis]
MSGKLYAVNDHQQRKKIQITKMMSHTHNHNHHSTYSSEKMQRYTQDYVEALQEELHKIQHFQRDLPLSLHLLTQAIEACKQQLSGTTTTLVLEEFIPINRTSSFDQLHKPKDKNIKNNDINSSQKSEWLKSVQLWNQTPDPLPKQDSPKNASVISNSGGAFHPFNGEKSVGTIHTTTARSPSSDLNAVEAAATATSMEGTGCDTGGGGGGGGGGAGAGGSKKEEKGRRRKERRYWSPELHRRFLHALQQLGSPDVATPKQIRELMNVDGLTNDEVKSHLQKYRLHTRTPSIHDNNNFPQTPQFVVLGGFWVPPPEYTMVTSIAAPPAPLP